MDPKKKAITAAVTGTALGIAGLAVIAMPASAGAAPVLPAVSAEDLVQSVATAKTPALSGTVKVTNNLGLPSLNVLPGASMLNLDSADVYNDGNGRSKLAIHQGNTQETITHDGTTVWDYNSNNNTVTKFAVPAGAMAATGTDKVSDPTTAATQLLAKVRETSTVAVDSETRLPLRLEVLTNGSADPALQIGFSEVNFAQQPASQFQFTPPKGAKVTEKQPKLDTAATGQIDQAQQDTKIVGDGWDTVLTGNIPADLLAGKQPSGKQPADVQGKGIDPKALLARLGKPVSGAWGSGTMITTKVGTAVITDDGRFAAGAVPEQVLFEALAAK